MKLQHPVTPSLITAPIKSLCNDLVPGGLPFFLNVTPVSDAKVSDCFIAVEQQIARHGGTACYGWQLWELPRVYIEAEFHAVWKNPDGQLEDITPKLAPFQRILFLPDPTRVYRGRQLSNERRALSSNPYVADFFKICDEEFEIMNRGARAYEYDDIILRPDEAHRLTRLRTQKAVLCSKLWTLVPDLTRNDPCWCGSGKKLKYCHSQ